MAPDRLPEERSFRIARSEDTRAPPDSTTFVLGPGLNVFELDVEFAATALVRGAIVGVGEDLARTFSIGAARPEDPERQGLWFQRAVPRADGSFEMRLPAGARYAIVAAARSMRPATGWIDLPSAGEYSLALTPEPGLSIDGQIAIAEGLEAEGIAIELLLETPAGAEPLQHWPQPHQVSYETLAWIDGSFEWSRRSTRLQAGGSFRLVGLAERPHELRVLAVGLPDVELGAFRAARLQPPAQALELGPLLAALTLELGPLDDGPLGFTLMDTRDASAPPLGPFVTDPRGAARLFLPPHSSFDVRVGEALVGRVISAAAGEHGDWSLVP